MEDDKGWDEYDDGDDEELSDENEGDQKAEKKEENTNQNNYSSSNGYNNGYYGYNNNYSYSGGSSKKYRKKKGNKKYYSKENESQYTNKNRQYNKDSGPGYKNISHDFVTNSNYMRNQNSDNNNYKNYNNNILYGKGRAYSNRDKNSWGNIYKGGKKSENEQVSKPMFTNSKLENNGNPEGNFVKIDVNPEEKKHFNLTNIGEVPVNDNQTNSLLTIKSLLMGKEPEKDIKINEEKTNENKNNEFELQTSNNINNNFNENSSSLPWRSGSYFGGKGGDGYKKDYYSKNYRNNKKDNNYYYSSGKNYNKNRYALNQPQSKRNNKFD